MVVEPTPSNCEQKSWTWQLNWKISAALNFSCDGQATDQTTTIQQGHSWAVHHLKGAPTPFWLFLRATLRPASKERGLGLGRVRSR